MVRAWLGKNPRQAGCLFLLLSALNVYCAVQVFAESQLLALGNLVWAGVLVLGVIHAWPERGQEPLRTPA